jgi:hypothetical protein
MCRRLRVGIALLACATAGALAPSANADSGAYQCGTHAPPCWTEFTVDGGAPPAAVNLMIQQGGGNIQLSLMNSGNFDLAPALSNDSAVHIAVDVGTYDPAVFATTGYVDSYASASEGDTSTVTLDLEPRSSSWNMFGCHVGSCGSDASPVTATQDYSSMLLGAITNLAGAPSPTIAAAMHGSWLSTNAQGFTFPQLNSTTGAVSFSVAAPHFMTDGTTINTGFFRAFLPDALVQAMGIANPSAVTQGSFTVTNSNGGTVVFAVSHVDSPSSGVLIESGTNPPTLPPFNYSSPTFRISRAGGTSSNATLKKLLISAGHLTPTFSPFTTSYNAGQVPFGTKAVTVTPTASAANSTIKVGINGGTYSAVVSGHPSKSLGLKVGSNKIDIQVTAANHTTKKTYSIAIVRRAS